MKELLRLEDIYKRFPTKETCIGFIERVRWNNSPTCPHCRSMRVTSMQKQFRHHCNACNTSFSVTVKTLFHNTRVPLQKWLAAIAIYKQDGKIISVRKLADALEVNKNTAWTMLARIKDASLEYGELFAKLASSKDFLAAHNK